MKKFFHILLAVAVVAIIYSPPTASGPCISSQAAAAQGGGGVIQPPFPFGIMIDHGFYSGSKRRKPNFFFDQLSDHSDIARNLQSAKP